MAAVATLSYADAQKIIDNWAATGGPTEEEQIEFAEAALKLLRDGAQVTAYETNVEQVGVWANEIDRAFDRVTRGFQEMVDKYGGDFSGLAGFLEEWRGYDARWVRYLRNSRDVASDHVTILRRFDQVFLEMVESISNDDERLGVIAELQQFIEEDHSASGDMITNFQTLSRDIEHFVRRFDTWITINGIELDAEARRLKLVIEGLQQEITVLDGQIRDSTIALVVAGRFLNILGVIIAGSVLASFQVQRNARARDLEDRQRELADVNRRQEGLAHIKTEFEGLKPDIFFICEKLISFAEIWASVRSQSVQFQGHLRGGMDAVSNIRFRLEVRLAREVSLPLMRGLQKYATVLENRGRN